MNAGELCEQSLQIRALLEDVLYRCMLDGDEVGCCLEYLIEMVTLRSDVLEICEEAFSVCVQRFHTIRADNELIDTHNITSLYNIRSTFAQLVFP